VVVDVWKALISKFWVPVVGALAKVFKSNDGVDDIFSVVLKSTVWVVSLFVVVVVVDVWKALTSKVDAPVVNVVPKAFKLKDGVEDTFSVVLKSIF